MEGGVVSSMASIINAAVTGVGSVITSVSSDTVLMSVAMVMLAGTIGALAFRTIKRFVH